MDPSKLESQTPTPDRFSDWVWKGVAASGKGVYKGVIPIIAGISIRVFSESYGNVFISKGLGLCIGSILRNYVVKLFPSVEEAIGRIAYKLQLVALVAIAELVLTFFFPMAGMISAFVTGIISGLFLESLTHIEIQRTEKVASDIVSGKMPD